MAKSKYAPALFEVISSKDDKSSTKLTLPKWWKGKVASISPAKPAGAPGAEVSPEAASSPVALATSALSPVERAEPVGAPEPTTRVELPAAPATPLGEPALPLETVASAPASTNPAPTIKPVRKPLFEPSSASSDEPPPMARVHEGRVELSFNPRNAIIVGGGIILLLFVAFQLGRGFSFKPTTTADATKQDSLEPFKKAPAAPNTLDVGPSGGSRQSGKSANSSKTRSTPAPANPTPAAVKNPPASPPAGPTAAQFIPGKIYVVLESFNPDDKDEAEQLQQWLASKHGIETYLDGGGGSRWQLVSTKGFENTETEKLKANEYAVSMTVLGKAYKKEFGSKANYDMRSPALKSIRSVPAEHPAKPTGGRTSPKK